MTILKKAKNKSLVQDVSQQIEEAIISGEYRPGDRLPSTRELQQILSASLGTIRESLAILKQKGFLEVRKGSKGGFFVCETSTKPMISSLETLMQRMVFTTRELYEFRVPVEAGLTGIVAQKPIKNRSGPSNNTSKDWKIVLTKAMPDGWPLWTLSRIFGEDFWVLPITRSMMPF